MTPEAARVVLASDPKAIEQALQVLTRPGVVAFPTDTVYGVGALLRHPDQIERLYRIKERDLGKPVAVLLGDRGQMDELAAAVPPGASRVLDRYWPGPLTVVVQAQAWLPPQVAPTGKVGLRVPDHEFTRALLRAAGPLAVTSANLSGADSTQTAEQVLRDLGGRVDLIVNGGRTPGGLPSTVVDLTGGKLEILRPGPILEEQIQALLGD